MATRVLLLVGTRKGTFIAESDEERRRWTFRGPMCEGWPIHDVSVDPATGAIFAAGGSPWYGPAVWRSDDLGGDVDPLLGRPDLRRRRPGDPDRLERDRGPRRGLRRRRAGRPLPQRRRRRDLGARRRPAGAPVAPRLAARQRGPDPPHDRAPRHRPRPDVGRASPPSGRSRLATAGATWETRNRGVRAGFMPDPNPEFGQCVHKLVAAAGEPETLYQQNHCGVYRSDDGGATWAEITAGLPSEFGFPMVAHPARPGHGLGDPAQRRRSGPLHARRRGRGLADARPRGQLGAARRRACPRRTPTSASCARRWRSTGSTRSASRSARAAASSGRAPTRGRAGSWPPPTCPPIWSVEAHVLEA